MLNRNFLIKLFFVLIGLIVGSSMALSSTVLAAGTLNLSQASNLTNNQTIEVSGSGFAKSSTGSIVECNNDSAQPTVTVAGNQVPVSCTNPLSNLVTTTSGGVLNSSSFTIRTGTIGPAASGTDSAGNNSAADASLYPCPPTASQIAKGDSCMITFGDAGGDDVSVNIAFQSSSTSNSGSSSSNTTNTAPSSVTSSNSTSAPKSSSTSTSGSPSTLVNTGPGNLVIIFGIGAILGNILAYGYFLFWKKSRI